MSVDLRCPNCGKVLGHASHEDNYVHHTTTDCCCNNKHSKIVGELLALAYFCGLFIIGFFIYHLC